MKLGNKTNSLVGVAISASLLPPAVNAGLFLAYAASGQSFIADEDYGEFTRSKMCEFGLVSFLLTIVNIICIYFSAIGMFKIKEVAPIPNKAELWKSFIPEVKKQKTIKNDAEGQKLQRMMVEVLSMQRQGMAAADMELELNERYPNISPEVRAVLRQNINYDYGQTVTEHLMAQKRKSYINAGPMIQNVEMQEVKFSLLDEEITIGSLDCNG